VLRPAMAARCWAVMVIDMCTPHRPQAAVV